MTDAAARAVLAGLVARGWTVAVAESLTGGLVTSALVDVPGASALLRGGVVAYATEIKASVLGVDAVLLERVGAVDREVARQMADGVRRLLGADVGIATTGVAGPDPQDGKAVGTVCIAVVTPEAWFSTEHHLAGDREAVRAQTVETALDRCLAHL